MSGSGPNRNSPADRAGPVFGLGASASRLLRYCMPRASPNDRVNPGAGAACFLSNRVIAAGAARSPQPLRHAKRSFVAEGWIQN